MRALWFFVAMVGMLSAITVSARSAQADVEPMTDLPFYRESGGVKLTCGWHQSCTRAAGYDPSKGAIDLAMFHGETVYSAGHGQIASGGPSGGCLGNVVTVDHGSQTSLYAHLNAWFWSSGGVPSCRHVALGAVGSSTCPDYRGMGTHLHFAGEDWPHFTPIYGRRPEHQTYHDQRFQFDPYATPPPVRPTLYHEGVKTLAYTVDDDQGNRERTESFVYPEAADPRSKWERRKGNGFGYWGMPRATYYTAEIPATDPEHYAYWSPFLPARDDYAIYAFIPNTQTYASASKAEYTINFITDSGAIGTDVAVLDQGAAVRAGKGNEWHRLIGAGGRDMWPGGTLGAGWSERLLNIYLRDGRTCGGNGDCEIEHLAADAMLFVPQSCGP
jgi:hypothetical protein